MYEVKDIYVLCDSLDHMIDSMMRSFSFFNLVLFYLGGGEFARADAKDGEMNEIEMHV